MKKYLVFIIIVVLFLGTACKNRTPDAGRTVVAEVQGNFLYLDDLQHIIPPNSTPNDSADLADKYIKKWATDILMYEKAKQNISDMSEIERLVDEYRKSLTIHHYQIRLLENRSTKKPTEGEMLLFYEAYGEQMILKENVIKGLLLIVPVDAPNIKGVTQWVKKGDAESIENIEKYSLQNAVSYDYFRDIWVNFTEIAQKTAFHPTNPAQFISSNETVELNDSTHHYFLRIDEYRTVGQAEPYELARNKIENILINKYNSDLISQIENELYNDALSKRNLKIYNPEEK